MEKTKPNSPDAAFLNEHCSNAHGADFFLKGMNAFDDIKGLTFHYLKGVFVTLLIVAGIFTLKFMYLYQPYIAPFIDHYVEKVNNFWSFLTYLSTPIAWLIKFIVWVIMVFTSMKIASLFMSFWIDTLIEKIISHFREVPDVPFSFSKTSVNILKGLSKSTGNLIFAFVFMILGFLPIVGPFFAFIGSSCSNGFDIMSPYLMILAESDDDVLRDFKITKAKTFKTGFVQSILNFIPAIGWFALPFTLLAQVVGYTFYCEEKWQEHNKTQDNS